MQKRIIFIFFYGRSVLELEGIKFMNPDMFFIQKERYLRIIRVPVTKSLELNEIISIAIDLYQKRITFAISKRTTESGKISFSVWRVIMEGDREKQKNNRDGADLGEVIEINPETLEKRNFVFISNMSAVVKDEIDFVKYL